MMKNALKSTSVIALCTALMTPASFAQDAEEQLEECTVTGPFPCVTEDGVRVENAVELARESLLPSDPDAENAQTEPEAPAEPETAETPQEPSEPGEEPAQAERGNGNGNGQGAANANENAQQNANENANAAEPDVAAETEMEAEAETEAEAATDAEVIEEAETDPADEPMTDEAAQAAAEEAVADEASEEEPAAAAEADAATDEQPMEEDATVEAETETDVPEAEAEADAQADAEATEEDGSLVENLAEEIADQIAPEDEDANVAAQAEAESDIPETPVEDVASEAAAAADTEEDDEMLDEQMVDIEGVETETVTEEQARSSDEEFDTQVTARGDAQANAQSGEGNQNQGLNRELTNFEKTVLAGLGGIAIGTVLANGDEIVSNSGDRIVVRNPEGDLEVLKNDDEILRRPGSTIRTRTYDDGSTKTVVRRENGVRIVTVREADGTTVRRVRLMPDGTRYVLFDDTQAADPVDRDDVANAAPRQETNVSASDEAALREALMASMNQGSDRRFSLRQVRQYESVRDLAPIIEVDAITFDTGSAVIRAGQAEELADLGVAIRDVIDEVPNAVFLIEGHTDAVGDASYNLALSDRRAESVALALTEYFDVPPENLITQGYGESELKIVTAEAERQNRRANVRNITPLLQ